MNISNTLHALSYASFDCVDLSISAFKVKKCKKFVDWMDQIKPDYIRTIPYPYRILQDANESVRWSKTSPFKRITLLNHSIQWCAGNASSVDFILPHLARQIGGIYNSWHSYLVVELAWSVLSDAGQCTYMYHMQWNGTGVALLYIQAGRAALMTGARSWSILHNNNKRVNQTFQATLTITN